jgi:UDP-N-acetylglucosamine enolpyruvyl transferase
MRIHVEGGHALNGVYKPSGNANAAMALLAAALLTNKPVTLRNIPRTSSTEAMIVLAEWLGATLTRQDETTLTIEAKQITQRVLTEQETEISIGVILFLAHSGTPQARAHRD